MNILDNEIKLGKVYISLPIYRNGKAEVSATVSEIQDLLGSLNRMHAVLCLLYYTNDSRLKYIRDDVQSKQFLTNEMIRNVSSMYPLEFASLTTDSPLTLKIISAKDIAEALEKILAIPINLYKNWIGAKKSSVILKEKELELNKLVNENKKNNEPFPFSKEVFDYYKVPEEFLKGIKTIDDFDKMADVIKKWEDINRIHSDNELTRVITALAAEEGLRRLYELPGFKEASSKIPSEELRVYNNDLLRQMFKEPISNLPYFDHSIRGKKY